MLYPKNQEKTLNPSLFRNPTAEYRGTPFWAWNCELDEDLLRKEIGYMKEMGFGGFHMHPRIGMSTKYLSDDFMKLISDCVDEAKKKEMLAWLYDEDKWPSGYAGGLNVKDEESRQKFLYFTRVPYRDAALTVPEDIAAATEPYPAKCVLLACYDIETDEHGYLRSYRKIGVGEKAAHRKWFAYLDYAECGPWFNGRTYCDTLQKPVIEDFVKVTHERYKEVIGSEFGKAVPAIFTDEPQFKPKRMLADADDREGAIMPFTTDFDDTFRAAFGYSIFEKLPEVFFELPDGKKSQARWHFHDHSSERFASAFSDTIGAWCEKNDIAMTGHLMQEPSLYTQTCSVGDCMRSYRGFTIPGIDMLADRHELSTAKQCQSAVHQYGREGMLSELYGVTNWYFDFKGHKQQGDWQATLGVTVRVPHLFWVSMHGEAKRDYPASIGYQSPWFREYRYIEDHFARVNTVMTRGKPIVRIGVIHPIESYWLCFGPLAQTGDEREERTRRYEDFLSNMLNATLDFDLICESLLPSQFGGTDGGFRVGEMAYEAVVVPGLSTIRSTTLDALEAFAEKGGKVIFLGDVPTMVDAIPSDRPRALAAKCHTIDWSMKSLFDLLGEQREVRVCNRDHYPASNIIYQLRSDGDKRHIFFSHIEGPKDLKYEVTPPDYLNVTLRGEWKLTWMDTLTGEIKPLAATYRLGNTEFAWEAGACDSLLLELTPGRQTEGANLLIGQYPSWTAIDDRAPFTLEEPNVLLLDCPRYSVNGSEIQPAEEILRADNKIRKSLGIRPRAKSMAQPWVQPIDKNPKDVVTLFYTFDSEIDYEGAELALESLAYATSATLNGVSADLTDVGWFVDEDSIRKIKLPAIRKGKNELTLTYRYGDVTQLESIFVLGKFGVLCRGRIVTVTTLPDVLGFDDIALQGLPFYGGNVVYHLTYEGAGHKALTVQRYAGAAIRVDVDGKRVPGMLAFPPHRINLGVLAEGKHRIDLTLFGNRQNTFGALHSLDITPPYCGPNEWRRDDAYFVYEYMLHENGILASPRILDLE